MPTLASGFSKVKKVKIKGVTSFTKVKTALLLKVDGQEIPLISFSPISANFLTIDLGFLVFLIQLL